MTDFPAESAPSRFTLWLYHCRALLIGLYLSTLLCWVWAIFFAGGDWLSPLLGVLGFDGWVWINFTRDASNVALVSDSAPYRLTALAALGAWAATQWLFVNAVRGGCRGSRARRRAICVMLAMPVSMLLMAWASALMQATGVWTRLVFRGPSLGHYGWYFPQTNTVVMPAIWVGLWLAIGLGLAAVAPCHRRGALVWCYLLGWLGATTGVAVSVAVGFSRVGELYGTEALPTLGGPGYWPVWSGLHTTWVFGWLAALWGCGAICLFLLERQPSFADAEARALARADARLRPWISILLAGAVVVIGIPTFAWISPIWAEYYLLGTAYASPRYLWFNRYFPGIPFLYLCCALLGLACLIHAIRLWLHRRLPYTDHCLACGYNLTGTVAAGRAACPECGETVSDEQFQAVARRLKARA